ncbi:transcription factor ILR3-like isoform X2 [Dendrobium catenatum]|uniref:transcription factor ILR3-like isoform X2 n=1 Tax=Dendrobium catenatum TaxID=906689 RepID=UPI0009F3A3F3|nr:transcription factor ILR3-like isoform X2 [Dendrobium catenatum]
MASPENPNWLLDCPLIDDLSAPPANGFIWAPQEFNHQSKVRPPFSTHEGYVSMGANDPFVETETFKEQGSQKRARSESSSQAGSKACREKMRRDRLNDKFLELGSILEPGKPPKLDKVAILCDATRMVTQLRADAQKLNDLNQTLQDKIKELKAEKIELRDEKQRLKTEKESLEQQAKFLNAPRPSFIPHPSLIPTAFSAPGKNPGQKLMMPVMGYPGFPMWQFMHPSDVDTSQDAESCPPVA